MHKGAPDEAGGHQCTRERKGDGISMNYLRITKDNIDSEHICCAISNNRDIQVSSKKAWLS